MRFFLFCLSTCLCFNFISINAQTLDSIQINGHLVRWPGKAERGDYFPAQARPHFDRTIPNNPLKGILSGGFSFDPKFITELGMLLDITSDSEIQELLERFNSQIDQNIFVLDALVTTLKDRKFFQIFEAFLRDQGTLVGEDSGYYSRPQVEDKIPRITVFGSAASVTSGAGHPSLNKTLLNANVIFHEVFHYALDKIDHYASETSGWDDHSSFDPIETRFRIVQTIKAGRSPLLASSIVPVALDRYNLDAPEDAVEHRYLTYFSQESPSSQLLAEVGELVMRPDFDTKYVEAAMLWNIMASARYPECPDNQRVYEDEDLRDLAYLHALNARLIIKAIGIASALARKHSTTIDKIYSSAEFQTRFDQYRESLARFTIDSAPHF